MADITKDLKVPSKSNKTWYEYISDVIVKDGLPAIKLDTEPKVSVTLPIDIPMKLGTLINLALEHNFDITIQDANGVNIAERVDSPVSNYYNPLLKIYGNVVTLLYGSFDTEEPINKEIFRGIHKNGIITRARYNSVTICDIDKSYNNIEIYADEHGYEVIDKGFAEEFEEIHRNIKKFSFDNYDFNKPFQYKFMRDIEQTILSELSIIRQCNDSELSTVDDIGRFEFGITEQMPDKESISIAEIEAIRNILQINDKAEDTMQVRHSLRTVELLELLNKQLVELLN